MQGVWQSGMQLHRHSFGDSGAMCLYDTLGNSQHPILCKKTNCRTTCSVWFIPLCTSQTFSCNRYLCVGMGHYSISSYGSECVCMGHGVGRITLHSLQWLFYTILIYGIVDYGEGTTPSSNNTKHFSLFGEANAIYTKSNHALLTE